MPVIRNPFRRTPAPVPNGLSSAPNGLSSLERSGAADGGFRSEDSSKSTSAINIVKNDDERNSYKMSVVNDSGVYLPPSPPEKKGFWRREVSSSSAKNRPPIVPPDEPFTISRESFDSYRRSFDISARSPVSDVAPRNSFDARPIRERASMDVRPSRMSLDVHPRMSLDSRPPPSRLSLDQRPSRLPQTVQDEGSDDGFEDVKLDDPRPIRRHGIFSRFGGERDPSKDATRPRSGIFSRRDHSAESVHESELNPIENAGK